MMNITDGALAQLTSRIATEKPEEAGTPLVVQYLHLLQRRKWVIIAVLGLSLMAALVVTLLTTPKYTATTRIEISREQKNVTNVEGIESDQVGRDLEFYQTQYSLLEAESLAERVVRRLRLDRTDSFWEAHGIDPDQDGVLSSGPRRSANAERQDKQRAAVQLLLTNVLISPIRGSSLVDISYTSTSPDMSARIANAWAEEFIAQNIARKFDSTAQARQFLENRLNELRGRLEQSERDLVNYAANQNIITLSSAPTENGRPAQERTLTSDSLEALNKALVAATADRIAAEARLAPGGAGEAGVTNPALTSLRERRADAAGDLAKILSQFERGYPEARALESRVRELDRSIAREEARVRGSISQEYTAAAAREQDLRNRVAQLSSALNSQRRASIQYNIYQREADTNRQLYDGLLQRYKEIGVAGVSANNIAIIDTAKAPNVPSSPKLLLNLALGAIFGLLLSIGLIFLLEQADEGLRDPTRVQELIGVPLLGSVPKASEEIVIADELRDPKSLLAEAYLSVRSSLAFSTDHGVPRSLMMVSAQPAEGKSTSSLALAAVLSRLGRKVIIVDADLRSPSLHKTLDLDNRQGLSNYLAGDGNLQDKIRNVGPSMDFLSAGPQPPSAAELLSGDRMFQLVRELESRYQHVIIDSPPILGLADAPLLSKTVEAVIFVVQAGEVAVRGLRSALARLRDVDAPIVGVILTKFEDRYSEYGYGYGFRYKYGNAEGDRTAEPAGA
ncbi:GumC family protein [Sphingomonas sp.]|jgi:capsular exopolysaccharide synthesis family protein|uniref:GumC family protein n=1 Tax=Sphingomonas sp. TaxID=28214 RepID=UPI002DF0F061|nr:polysaccharide biosynthesis tyrosine autokinase [Sphingomonas sp.]HEV2568142.1 polysaccharide biosynthesis tyrosine autokinase [Sphingomonas sp.]